MRKKSEVESREKRTPSVVSDPQVTEPGVPSEPLGGEPTSLSPPTKPTRKRQMEVHVLGPPPPTKEVFMAEDLAKACLSPRTNILSELKTRKLGEDWSWVNKIYPDGDDEEVDVSALGDSKVGDLPSVIEVTKESELRTL
ncbi:hypothetical protein JCGZ_18424 [Jatropha curcas]|uniref:Uncharacterized protein n=1 Tax=Jatropha curcas TaxID=180498 RepID=A0A067KDC4_JATCU|nr:hypothetical protein JCGZ_18424 [Jatropha curcas]